MGLGIGVIHNFVVSIMRVSTFTSGGPLTPIRCNERITSKSMEQAEKDTYCRPKPLGGLSFYVSKPICEQTSDTCHDHSPLATQAARQTRTHPYKHKRLSPPSPPHIQPPPPHSQPSKCHPKTKTNPNPLNPHNSTY